jgi:ABC-type xylose transport system substrate-binding protein
MSKIFKETAAVGHVSAEVASERLCEPPKRVAAKKKFKNMKRMRVTYLVPKLTL